MNQVTATGQEHLRLATTLLQRMRLASPEGGVWEAADVQWWSRLDGGSGQFWLDEDGGPRAACLSTIFKGGPQHDVLVLPGDQEFGRDVWQAAIAQAGSGPAGSGPAEFTVRRDDETGTAALEAAGYLLTGPASVVACWLNAADRPPVPALPDGYRLRSRAQDRDRDRPHPMIDRNGEQVEQRLRECSLYRPELDLELVAPDGRTAGYGLFWPDPVTGIGLVEPIRTSDAHQGLGLASRLVAAGLDLLAGCGCGRLKVCNDRGLYRRAGFRRLDSATAGTYALPRASG